MTRYTVCATGSHRFTVGAWFLLVSLAAMAVRCGPAPDFDILLRGGAVYDGSGNPPFEADVGIRGDSIAAIGDLSSATALTDLNVAGFAVAPGFVNMLSWANRSLIEDGRGMSDVLQGVTLEVMGEGWSMGPWNDDMKRDELAGQDDIRFEIEWTTLGEYLEYLERRGVSPNVASFVGATTLRIHEVGHDDRPPTVEELERMRMLARTAMEEGAMGVSTSLIYAPAFYAETAELTELARVAGEYGGMYISHIRNEGAGVLEAIDELVQIAREAGVPAEIYHLKASGRENWHLIDDVLARIEAARAKGLRITADMYTYPASSTGLNALMPRWVQEGGFGAWRERLLDPLTRRRVLSEMRTSSTTWENTLLSLGPEGVIVISFRQDSLRYLVGKTLREVADLRGTSPEDAVIDLVVADSSRVGAVFFSMTEDNIRKKVAQPWVSFGSDGAAMAAEGVFLNSQPHPRGYGNFARVLGKYVREEGVISLAEAIRRLTSQPAVNLSLRRRGLLRTGYFADVVVFDPVTIADRATFEQPHQYAVGVRHVFVNGGHVVDDGVHTGERPGRVVRGPGWRGWRQ